MSAPFVRASSNASNATPAASEPVSSQLSSEKATIALPPNRAYADQSDSLTRTASATEDELSPEPEQSNNPEQSNPSLSSSPDVFTSEVTSSTTGTTHTEEEGYSGVEDEKQVNLEPNMDDLTRSEDASDGSDVDHAVGDSSMGDSSMGDSSMGDSSMGDSSLGDSFLGDSSMGDGSIGDLGADSDQNVEKGETSTPP